MEFTQRILPVLTYAKEAWHCTLHKPRDKSKSEQAKNWEEKGGYNNEKVNELYRLRNNRMLKVFYRRIITLRDFVHDIHSKCSTDRRWATRVAEEQTSN